MECENAPRFYKDPHPLFYKDLHLGSEKKQHIFIECDWNLVEVQSQLWILEGEGQPFLALYKKQRVTG